MGKMIVLTFTDSEETAFQRAVSLLGGEFGIETIQPVSSAVLSFHGLEIRQHQRRVLRDSRDIRLTRLEYGTLVLLASNPEIVFTQSQIFEAVWSMDSDSCHSSVKNVILENRSDRLRSADFQRAGLLGIVLKSGSLFQNFDFRNSRVSVFAIQEFRFSQSNNTDII